MNRSSDSFGGIAGPGLVSVLYPYAPPAVVSASQYIGGTYSYGPVIFTPDAPVTVVGDLVLIFLPAFPALPCVAASPSRHNQDAELVGLIEKVFVIDAAFQAHGVQPHVAHIRQIGINALRRIAQEHVRRPRRSANQNFFAVDFEKPVALVRQLRSRFANAERHLRGIRNLPSSFERQLRLVQ